MVDECFYPEVVCREEEMKFTFRIWILIIILGLSLLAIKPSFGSGVLVDSVDKNSSIYEAGLRVGDVIKFVNGKDVQNLEDYGEIMSNLFLDEQEKKLTIETTDNEFIILTDEIPDVIVRDLPRTNIQTGLDLRGGARALVSPEGVIDDAGLEDLIDVSRNRFNTYGLTDLKVTGASDLDGNRFMLIEIAGATPEDLEELISKEGKFEAKVGNETVFVGGEDISDVCRNDASCSGLQSCFQIAGGGGFACNYAFTIYLKKDAAQRHADVTGNLSLDPTGRYLEERLYLFVDDVEVDSLLIGSSLKGQVTTQISIQGSGSGETEEDARVDARASMKKLQTIMITGSLPYKLTIEKLDTVSPTLGKEFGSLLLFAGGVAIFLVGVVVFLRYRKFKASLALMFTAVSELVIILGVAAMIRWNLDLPSIAGILATIGTGVDQQIVILDEAERGKSVSLKERMKRALFVIGTAYLTTVVSLIPLYKAGAGLFKGFVVTTFIGITAGVLITRPAFADMMKSLGSD